MPDSFYLDEKDQTWLQKIESAQVSDAKRQELYKTFNEAVYKKYKIKETRFFTITTFPVEFFGKVTIDKNRERVIKAKKISKSDQPSEIIHD